VRAVIVAGGEVDPTDRRLLQGADLVIGADSGALTLLGWAVRPDVVVGDLDSLGPRRVEELRKAGARIDAHLEDKDETDTELAIRHAARAGATDIIVLGALGGARVDHALANVLILADEMLGHGVRLVRGHVTMRALRGGATIELAAGVGSLVTLLPLGGDVVGVRTEGLRYALDGGTLPFGSPRGTSNVVESVPARVAIAAGLLLVIESART
jgi:thiamine pyrophosphokinase